MTAERGLVSVGRTYEHTAHFEHMGQMGWGKWETTRIHS